MDSNFVIIATGNEITAGEVVNTNASYLAQEISALFGEVTHHLSVRDGVKDIVEALTWGLEKVNHVVITGGLGPTTDDLTRNAVAEVAGKKLVLSDEAWQDITLFFESMGRKTSDGHKAQCHFPDGATRYRNLAGTADGFLVSLKNNKFIWVLPGPPRELKSVWENGMKAALQKSFPPQSKELLTWTFIGRGESEVADYCEEAFKNLPVQLGYRAKVPFVIFKVWVLQKDKSKIENAIAQVETKFSKNLVAKGPWNGLTQITQKLKNIRFGDYTGTGKLASRLLEAYQSKDAPKDWTIQSHPQMKFDELNSLVTKLPANVRADTLNNKDAKELYTKITGVLVELENGSDLEKQKNSLKNHFVRLFIIGDQDALMFNDTLNSQYFLRIPALWNRKLPDDRLMQYFVESVLIELNK